RRSGGVPGRGASLPSAGCSTGADTLAVPPGHPLGAVGGPGTRGRVRRPGGQWAHAVPSTVPQATWGAEPAPLDLDRALGGARRESGADGEWQVRTVRGGTKTYLCPGCNQEIPPGTGHVVAWQDDSFFGAETALDHRRHW